MKKVFYTGWYKKEPNDREGKKRHPNRVGKNVLKKQCPKSRRVADILRMMINLYKKAGFLAKKLEKCRNGARKKLESGLLGRGKRKMDIVVKYNPKESRGTAMNGKQWKRLRE